MRTRVGYAGGTSKNPTYRSIGDHAETIEIDFDPSVTSYKALVDVFFATHNPCRKPWSRQYMSAVFYANDEQRQIVEAAANKLAKERGQPVQTEISKLDRFYLAEDYHQKYRLRSHHDLTGELVAMYPKLTDFVNSTAATRINAWLGGHGSKAQLEADLPRLGLTAAGAERLRATVHRGLR